MRAAGLMPVKSEHQQAKFLPEQLEQLWDRYPERYSIIPSKCCCFPVISFWVESSNCSHSLSQSPVCVLVEQHLWGLWVGWAQWVPILPDVHHLLASRKGRWNVWLNKWIICIFGWCFVLFIFFAKPGISNLQLFLFVHKWIPFFQVWRPHTCMLPFPHPITNSRKQLPGILKILLIS